MKKAPTKTVRREDDGMRAEYDFAGGVRGKHYRAMQAGYTITIRREDGTTVTKEVKPKEGAVILAPDVREYFPDAESVNAALRSLIGLIPQKHTAVAKRAKGGEARRGVAFGGGSKSTGKRTEAV
jgi:hypothetical protein